MQNSKLIKLRTVLSVLLLIFTISSFTLASAENHHESHCTEDNCPICLVFQVAKVNLGGFILTFAAIVIICHFAKSEKITFSSITESYISNTLFSLKTRLND